MASRASLNKVLLIGNLTRDPELRYTPSGAAVCTFGLATNRTYMASDGTKKEEAEFTKIVCWNKLAELCSQLLTKGRKVYVEGRLQTRSWETPDGVTKQTTEVVIDDMRILDSRRDFGEVSEIAPQAAVAPAAGDEILAKTDDKTVTKPAETVKKTKGDPFDSTQGHLEQRRRGEKGEKKEEASSPKKDEDEIDLEDLPF